MDAFPSSPEERASLIARYEPLQSAYDDLYDRIVDAIPEQQFLAAANQLRLLRGREVVADEVESQVLEDYALHLALSEEETLLTRLLDKGFVEEGSEDERLLRAMMQARFSFFEVIEIFPGLGYEVYDLLRDARSHVVITEELPAGIVPGHHFMSRLVTVDGITMLGCPGFPVPEALATQLAEGIREEEELVLIGPKDREPLWLSQALIELLMKLKKEAEEAERLSAAFEEPCRCGSGLEHRFCCGALN